MQELFTSPDVLVFIAGGCLVLGYLIINQVLLRMMVLMGTLFYIAYYATAAAEPLWPAIYLSIAQGSATLIGLALLSARKSRLAIPHGFKDLYPRFSQLPPGDFRALMRLGRRYVTDEEEVLGREGVPVERLVYIISGNARVRKRGEDFELPPGLFIGEVAMTLNTGSAATTILPAGSEIIVWDKTELEHAGEKKPRFKLALQAALSHDMARKVALAVAPGDMRAAAR